MDKPWTEMNLNCREQRYSSEDSVYKLLHSQPNYQIDEDDDDDGFAISRESYAKLSQHKQEYETETTDYTDTELCYNAQVKVTIAIYYALCRNPSSYSTGQKFSIFLVLQYNGLIFWSNWQVKDSFGKFRI